MRVAVILPSRGLMFSQTADEILQNLRGIDHKFYFSHRKPIPDCFETPTNQALDDDSITHLWFIEDDMILPPKTLRTMLDKNLAVITVNYPTTKNKDSAILTVKGRIVYAGTGCTLVRREVFNELKKPYFRTDIAWIPKNFGDYIKFTAVKKDKEGYGLHDVNFFINLFRRDIPVHKLDFTVGQRKLKALGKAGTNDGAHDIEEWTEVEDDRYDRMTKDLPIEKTGDLVEVATPEGNFMVKQDHADKLINAGRASRSPIKAVVIDDSEAL